MAALRTKLQFAARGLMSGMATCSTNGGIWETPAYDFLAFTVTSVIVNRRYLK
jgi:hypothetical protein